jgi:hypothetical protein
MLASPENAMANDTDDILDDLFQHSAWAAYLDQAVEQQGWPDSEATRLRAYAYYEAALARRCRRPAKADDPAKIRTTTP